MSSNGIILLRRPPKDTKHEGRVSTKLFKGNVQHASWVCQLQALRKAGSRGEGACSWHQKKGSKENKNACGACLFLSSSREFGVFFSLQVRKWQDPRTYTRRIGRLRKDTAMVTCGNWGEEWGVLRQYLRAPQPQTEKCLFIPLFSDCEWFEIDLWNLQSYFLKGFE